MWTDLLSRLFLSFLRDNYCVFYMLQILSGKFFNENIAIKEFKSNRIFYSNMIFGKIETDLWIWQCIDLNSGISSYLLTLRGYDLDSTSQFFHPEAFMNLGY